MCAIRGFVDRLLTTRTVIAVIILLLLASWIYPPWILYGHEHRWLFIFDTSYNTTMRVDFGRLLLLDGIIVAVGGLLAWGVFSNSTARRVTVRFAFYALIILPLIGVVCLGAVVIEKVQREVTSRKFLSGESPKGFDPDKYLAQKGPQDDLKKITLFDVDAVLRPPAWERGISYWDFTGRVHNDLSRAVEKIGVKVFFCTADVYNLPVGWIYRLEVIEAHYVDSEPWKKDPIVR